MDESMRVRAIVETRDATLGRLAREPGPAPLGFIEGVERLRDGAREKLALLSRGPEAEPPKRPMLRLDRAAVARRNGQQQRHCDHGDCRRELPEDASPHRRFCDEHAKPRWRMHRYRAKQRD
jgi:hypothetical protein